MRKEETMEEVRRRAERRRGGGGAGGSSVQKEKKRKAIISQRNTRLCFIRKVLIKSRNFLCLKSVQHFARSEDTKVNFL